MDGLGGIGSKMIEAIKGAASAVGAKLSSLTNASDGISKTSNRVIKLEIKKIDDELKANRAEVGRLSATRNKSRNPDVQAAMQDRIREIGAKNANLIVQRLNLTDKLK